MKSLTPERWQQIKLVLYDALELPPQRRPEFLAKACSSDVSLLKEVESLLSLGDDEARTSFLESTRRRVTLPAGTKLRDYEVQSLLGVGGMGEVYRAHDPRLGRDVAIKVLPSIFAGDPDRLRRFEQEARAAAALNHPNILAIFDIGATGEATPYVVSELLEGETLRECVRRGPLPVGKTIDLALQLTSGLAAAHEKGIIHRDLKPENLFLTTDGRLKILDFGLAKLERRPASSPVDALTLSQETGAGVVLGTAGYMSPEQVRGLAVDQRSDIFAVGAIVYEMLSGIRAFQGDTAADTMNAILSRDAPPLSEVNSTIPPALERIVRRCLEKNPNERFHSIRDVAFALEAISDVVSQIREGQPDGLRRRLRGDLDNIVLKALQKKPQRRYDSVAEFSQDIDRHLQHLPVKARSSTLVYRVSKFVQRHKTEVSASVIVLLMTATLGLVVGGMFWKLRLGQKSTEKDRTVLGDRATAQPTVAERRLTANPDDARVTSSAISPDGKYLAFTDKTGFYLRQVDGGETHAVPLPKGFDALAESWFPDSIHLVVSWVEDPKEPPSLWEISVMGGTPRKLADAGASARVSPDGSKIAFLSGIYGAEIWLMRADGGEAKRIVGDAETEAYDTFSPVAWAPDGRGLAYVRTTTISWSEITKIEITDIASGQTEVVLSKRGLGPALTWTGAWRLIYSLQEPPPNQNDFNLWCVQLDARSARPLGTSTRVTSDRGRAAEVSVSNDGKLLALRRWTPQSDVYVAELEAGGKRLGTPHRLTLDERQDAPFSWTPDSKAVLFASDRDGPWHIFKQAIDQTQPELLVGGNDRSIMPRLTPDGSALLYLVVPKPGDSSHNFQIMRVPLNGGASQFVLQAPGIWNQQCARLPSTLCIYSSRGPNQNFFSFDPLNGTARVLTTIEGGPFFWSLSPDGKDLAVVKEGGQTNPVIQILSISDNSKRTIPVPGWSVIRNVDWSADGKSLWVSALNTRSGWHFEWFLQTFALLNIDLDGRVTARLPKGDVSFLWAVPSPEGRRLALYGATYSSNVWLLENF